MIIKQEPNLRTARLELFVHTQDEGDRLASSLEHFFANIPSGYIVTVVVPDNKGDGCIVESLLTIPPELVADLGAFLGLPIDKNTGSVYKRPIGWYRSLFRQIFEEGSVHV